MSRYGSIIIDGKDAWGEYGFVVLKGSMGEWLTFPEMKEPFFHNWKDQPGLEVDLEHVFVKEKNVSLKILFVSDSQLGFWENYNKALTAFTASGIRKIYYRELEKEFEVYYTKCSNISTPTRLRETNKIIVEMTIHFIMPDPTKVIEKLIAPTGIVLNVPVSIVGEGEFTYAILPIDSSQHVRVLIVSGNATVSGNLITATGFGQATIRVESVTDKRIFAEKTFSVYPDNIIVFADGDFLSDGIDFITIN